MPFMEECLNWPLSQVLRVVQDQIMQRSKYHGIPTLKSPLDFWIYQEILWETQPDFIVEIGNFYGGSTLALAHACDAIGKGHVIGIDTNHSGIYPNVKSHPRITLVGGAALDVYSRVKSMLKGSRNVLVIDDSVHSYDHTLKVLQTYSPLIGIGHYFIVEDGICNHGLDGGPNPGPYEAVEAFLKTTKKFTLDRAREAYCITWNPKGYLKKIAAD